jgi:hypothetical protein
VNDPEAAGRALPERIVDAELVRELAARVRLKVKAGLVKAGPPASMTWEQAVAAITRCDRDELAILVSLTPHEACLALEAKVYANATIREGT